MGCSVEGSHINGHGSKHKDSIWGWGGGPGEGDVNSQAYRFLNYGIAMIYTAIDVSWTLVSNDIM